MKTERKVMTILPRRYQYCQITYKSFHSNQQVSINQTFITCFVLIGLYFAVRDNLTMLSFTIPCRRPRYKQVTIEDVADSPLLTYSLICLLHVLTNQ